MIWTDIYLYTILPKNPPSTMPLILVGVNKPCTGYWKRNGGCLRYGQECSIFSPSVTDDFLKKKIDKKIQQRDGFKKKVNGIFH